MDITAGRIIDDVDNAKAQFRDRRRPAEIGGTVPWCHAPHKHAKHLTKASRHIA